VIPLGNGPGELAAIVACSQKDVFDVTLWVNGETMWPRCGSSRTMPSRANS